MKKRTIIVLAIAAMLAVSCESVYRADGSGPMTTALYYSVDGGDYQGGAVGYSSDNELINDMLDKVLEGHTIVITPESERTKFYGAKPIVFKTRDRDEAFQWVKRMSRRGYRVSVSYDTSRGEYRCIAEIPKNRSVSFPQARDIPMM